MSISPDDAAYCEQEVRAHDPERWLASLFAPDALRPGLHAILAFDLELARIGETATQPMLGEIRLQWWREALDGIFAGAPRGHPVARALAAVATPPMRDMFDRAIDARADDLYETPPPDLSALMRFGADASGSLTETAAISLGAADEASRKAARAVGAVWAVLARLRDWSPTAGRRRMPLPEVLVTQAGSTIDQLIAAPDARIIRDVLDQVELASLASLAEARAARPKVSHLALPVLLPARLMERELRGRRSNEMGAVERPSRPRLQLSLLAGAILRRW